MKRQKSATFAKTKLVHKYTNHKICRKVRDPCHYKGKYRVAARSICNLKDNVPK